MSRKRRQWALVSTLLVAAALGSWALVAHRANRRAHPRIVPPSKATVFLYPAAVDDPHGRRFGFIDRNGTMVLSAAYVKAKPFSEGLAPVAVEQKPERYGDREERWGFIDSKGKLVIPPQFYEADVFSEGLAGVRTNDGLGDWAYITRTGETAIQPVRSKSPYKKVIGGRAFRGGTCYVVLARHWTGKGGSGSANWGLIDTRGDVLGEYAPLALSRGFGNGLRLVMEYGYLDSRGQVRIPIKQYADAKGFSDGMAEVATWKDPAQQKGVQWGYIDTSGTLRIAPHYEATTPFYKGKAWVKPFGHPWEITNKAGKVLATTRYNFEKAYPFSEDRALVVTSGTLALLDPEANLHPINNSILKGKEVTEYNGFRNGLAELYLAGPQEPQDKLQVYLNPSGRIVWRSDQSEAGSPTKTPAPTGR